MSPVTSSASQKMSSTQQNTRSSYRDRRFTGSNLRNKFQSVTVGSSLTLVRHTTRWVERLHPAVYTHTRLRPFPSRDTTPHPPARINLPRSPHAAPGTTTPQSIPSPAQDSPARPGTHAGSTRSRSAPQTRLRLAHQSRGSTTTNSSPPYRATMSMLRTERCKIVEIPRNTSSPTRCP